VSSNDWITAICATGALALGLLTAFRGGRSPLVLPLALLCFCVFGWNVFDLAHSLTGERAWVLLDHTTAPLTAPLVLHLMLAFTGRRRRHAWILVLAYVPLALLGATALLGLVSPTFARFATSSAFDVAHPILAVPVLILAMGHLVVYLREADPEGRQRARLILAGVFLGVTMSTIDLVHGFFPTLPMPPLDNLGTMLAMAPLAIATMRLRLFGYDMSTSGVSVPATLALVIVMSYGALFGVLRTETAALVLGTATAALALGMVLQLAVRAIAARRGREVRLATLGRFAGQLAHDLKNPLAAMKGAVQFLAEEQRRGASLDPHTRFIELLGAQVERMERSIAEYERLGRVEPTRAQLELNALVRDVLGLQALAPPRGVDVRLELGADLPALSADRDLLARALENLVRNALEAMADGGTLAVSTASRGAGVALMIRDSGHGMDAATVDQAFDDFFTTKASGSGLGLPFARRVAQAHGGELSLSSRRGRGTVVEIWLPSSAL
jgi:signal transduction histidine kinase